MFARSCLPILAQAPSPPTAALLRPLAASCAAPSSAPRSALLSPSSSSAALVARRRPFSTTPSADQRARSASRPPQPLRSRAMGGLPPPLPRGRSGLTPPLPPPAAAAASTGSGEGGNRTPIGRIRPARVPASEAIPGTPGAAEPADDAASAMLARTFDEFELRNARSNVWRPVLWAVLTIGTIYVAAATLTNDDTAAWADKLGAGSFWRRSAPTQKEMMDAKRLELMKDLQQTVGGLQKALAVLPEGLANPLLHGYVAVAESWLNTSEAKRFAAAAIAANALVFIGWRIPRLHRTMVAAWTHSPISGKSYTLLTSAFSHAEIWHFGFNMYALWSFTPMAYSFLVHGDRAALSSFPGTQESTAIWHLTAFYLAAAIAASLGSHLHANLVSLPRFLSRLTTAARAGAPLARAELFPLARKAQLNGSVGASGALYAILAIGALAFPAAQVGIVFVPFVSLPIPLAVGALCALDLVGVVRGWQTFNHAAHLAGAVFGGLYWRYGCDLWNWFRHSLRPPSSPSRAAPPPAIL